MLKHQTNYEDEFKKKCDPAELSKSKAGVHHSRRSLNCGELSVLDKRCEERDHFGRKHSDRMKAELVVKTIQ